MTISERYRSIGMLGKEMGYENSTCQMQFDAKKLQERDKKEPCFIYSGGLNGKVSVLTDEPRHDKSNKMSVRPAKSQISLGIRPV